jgi:hypothetical protein
MHDSPPVKKRETSVQRARRTATRHAYETQLPPASKLQIPQGLAVIPRQPLLDSGTCQAPGDQQSTLVSHCWTRACAGLQAPRCRRSQQNHLSSAIAGPRKMPDSRRPTVNSRQPLLDSRMCWSPSRRCHKREQPSLVSRCWTQEDCLDPCPRRRRSKPDHFSSANAGLRCVMALEPQKRTRQAMNCRQPLLDSSVCWPWSH